MQEDLMQTLDHDQVARYIEASPQTLYDIVADVTRMPELSPEIIRCEWLDGATSAIPGARFKATNKVEWRPAWNNMPVITVADRGRELAFSRTEPFAGTVVWRYRFEPEGRSTRVGESYEVTSPVTPIGWFIIGGLFGRHNRRADLRRGMDLTLQRLGALAKVSHAALPGTRRAGAMSGLMSLTH
jgi:hypothetical protein